MTTTISYPNREDFASLEDFTTATINAFLTSAAVRNAKETYVADKLGTDRRTARAALKISGQW